MFITSIPRWTQISNLRRLLYCKWVALYTRISSTVHSIKTVWDAGDEALMTTSKDFFSPFFSFNRRVTVIDPQWQPTGSVSGVCGDALVVKRKCSVSLFYSVWCVTPTSLNSTHHSFRLILEPVLRVSGVLGCVVENVFTCGSRARGTWLTEPGGGEWHSIYSRASTPVCNPAESAQMWIISAWSRFLKTQTDPPTRTGRKNQVTLSQFLLLFFFVIYGLDLGLLPAFSQCHLKGESELITFIVPCAC